jgi:hypothetical protein
MFDVEEFTPLSEMSNHTAEKLIIVLHPIFRWQWNVFMLHTLSYTMYSNIYWLPSNLNLTAHQSRWMTWNTYFCCCCYSMRSPPWLDWPLCNTCATHDHGQVPLDVNTSRSFLHSWLITGINRMVATSGAGTAYPSAAHGFTPCFSGDLC